MLRQYLRHRRALKRIAKDAQSDALLATPEGRAELRKGIDRESGESSLIALLEQALDLPGDVIECGVYRGASLRRIALATKDRAPQKTVFGLDSFEGFPEDGVSDQDTSFLRSTRRLSGKFKDAADAPTRIEAFARAFDLNVTLKKGYFEHTLPSVTDREFCFLHIDCDTYSGHVEVLDALYDRLTPGAVIVFDDYADEAWPGATKAVDEFFGPKGIAVEKSEARATPAWYAIKPA